MQHLNKKPAKYKKSIVAGVSNNQIKLQLL
jgi:hypothetical protein